MRSYLILVPLAALLASCGSHKTYRDFDGSYSWTNTQAYREGYQSGFDRGYQEGMDDQDMDYRGDEFRNQDGRARGVVHYEFFPTYYNNWSQPWMQPFGFGAGGTKATNGTAETVGITAGIVPGALAVATAGITIAASEEATIGTTPGAGIALGATAVTLDTVDSADTTDSVDTMDSAATTDSADTVATADSTNGTTKDGEEYSLAAVARAEVLINPRPTTDCGGSKFNREQCPTGVRW
jgi:hypothetical protein